MKKTNNKGFSLVELIVVVAIMAVLIGVLAPQYLRYVEKSRLQKDNAAIGELANSIKIACAEEKCYAQITAGAYEIELVHNATTDIVPKTTGLPTGVTVDEVGTELSKSVGKVSLSSATYSANVTLHVTADSTNGTVAVYTDGWINAPGEGASSRVF